MRASRLRSSLLLAVLAVGCLALACGGGSEVPLELDPSSRRQLSTGVVVGATGVYGSHVWKAIPFAAPPTGERRFRASLPPEAWKGERESLADAVPCPQFASVFAGAPRDAEGVIGAEDCLTVDVYAPHMESASVRDAEPKPVLAWIHGGGNTIGMADFYDGGQLAQTQDVIVVVMQYRLGPFGWMRNAALREGASPAEQSGNFGTLDTIRALEWIRDEIAAFGGDPERVTVFGESAGGRNVFALLSSPLAEGLFHGAIVQSGGLSGANVAKAENFADAEEPGAWNSSNETLLRLLVSEGQAADAAAARVKLEGMPAADVAAFLRGLPPETLLLAYTEQGGNEGMIEVPQMFADGVVLPEGRAIEAFRRGDYHRVPVILGTNRDENRLFMAFDPEFSEWRFFGLVPTPRDWGRYEAHGDGMAKAWKARAVDTPARLMRAVQGPSVYAYRWDWDEQPTIPFVFDGGRTIGAGHGLEIPFVFGHWDVGPQSGLLFNGGNEAGRLQLSNAMMSYWAQFAATGSPGSGRRGDLAEWRAWDDGSDGDPRFLVLDTEQDGGLRMASEEITMEGVIAEAMSDPRFTERRDLCAWIYAVIQWEDISAEIYPGAEGAACSAFAYDDYPWAEVAAR
ncbi:MAG: carboxylesterase family protein [Myxococcota bacterium]|nr:carboxylesterase family protein [Myxococcota bacterium]